MKIRQTKTIVNLRSDA